MKLLDVMSRPVETISPDDHLNEAARRMAQRDVGCLPVCDGDRLMGMLTDRDIVVRAVARGEDPSRVRVADAMTYDVEWCFEDHSLEDVGRHMADMQIRRIVVLDRDRRLVGIVSLGDIARARGNAPVVTHAFENIAEPTRPGSVQQRFHPGATRV